MKIEIRSATEAVIEGYVNAVERDSRPIPSPTGTYTERVAQGTFQKALNNGRKVELRFNHERVLGDTTNGTLELREDTIGLHAKALVTDAGIIEKAKRGELRGWSFGFRDNNPKIEDSKRILSDIELREVSILDKTPAYIATSIEMRSDDFIENRGYEDADTDITDNSEEQEERAEVDYTLYEKEIEILSLGGN